MGLIVSNLVLSNINYADAATLSAGSWLAGLPLANLQSSRMSKLARSTNDDAASSKFDVDLGATPVVVRVFGLFGHNFSQDATIRITAGASPGATTLDTGTVAAWQPVYGLWDREFEHPDWFSGRVSAAEAAATLPKVLYDFGLNHLHRYWRVEIVDTANAAGYVQCARLWMGPGWQPTINFDWGESLGWQPRDRAIETRSGARIAERLTPRRVFRFQLHELSDQEAFGRALEMNRALGSEGEIVVIPDPADAANAHRRNILGRVASWGDGIVDAALGKQVMTATVEERL